MATQEWLGRLIGEINAAIAAGRSLRNISGAAGMAENYVSQMVKEGKVPNVDRFLRLCQALNVSPVQILTGVEIDRSTEEMLRILKGLHPDLKTNFLNILRSYAQAPAAPTELPPVDRDQGRSKGS